MSDYSSCLHRVGMHQHHRSTCGLYLSLLQANKRCQSVLHSSSALSAQQWDFETRLLNVWDCFLSNSSPCTRTATGHINTVCRSFKQFVSALSLHARGEPTAESNTLFAKCDSPHPENLGGGAGFTSSLPFALTYLPQFCANIYLSGCPGCFDSG